MKKNIREKKIMDGILDSSITKARELDSKEFPRLDNMSGAFFYQFIPYRKEEKNPEFIYFKIRPNRHLEDIGIIGEWNFAWEAGSIRQELFAEDIPPEYEWLIRYKEKNFYIIPMFSDFKYVAYGSLFHLIPFRTLNRFDLPLITKGLWPFYYIADSIEKILPPHFNFILEKAFAYHVWPLINPVSKIKAFSSSDPLKILAHNLDFWLPYIFKVAENRLQTFGRVPFENEKQQKMLEKIKAKIPSDIEADRPLKGGAIWMGEEEAWDATCEMVELADSEGKLRGIIDAVRSNRVEEDFSEQWSFEREDFERKLYRKRNKIKVSFVELTDTVPVHGPESEVHENILWEDFFGLLDKKERRIVICLRSGKTNLGEIGKELGYKNHSPISKSLAKIRLKALNFLNC